MKKFLLTGFALTLAGAAFAAPSTLQPQTFPDETIEAISNNGQWSAGLTPDGNGTVIRNYATGQKWQYDAEMIGDAQSGYEPVESYQTGNGRCVSNNGVVVGVRNGQAAYWEDGEWILLTTLSDEGESAAAAITPDGNIIVGYAGRVGISIDATELMALPVLWYRQEDGTYGNPVELPHPTKDITGRLPQYVNAIAISDDGKTVGASMQDYSGILSQPVVITCNDSGEWTYKMLGNEILNPDNLQFPEYPGEFDEAAPSVEDYMTEQEFNEYVTAHDAWMNAGENPNTEPSPTEFMTEEEKAAYYAVYLPWLEAFNNWYSDYMLFENQLIQLMDSGCSMYFNNIVMTPDGKYLASTRQREELIPNPEYGDFDILKFNAPVMFDTSSGEYTIYPEDLSIYTTALSENGSLLGNTLDFNGIAQKQAYIFLPKSTEGIPLEYFIFDIDPAIGEWMEDQMIHDVYVLTESGSITHEDMMCTGIPVCTPDLSVIGTSIGTDTWVSDEAYCYAYIFPTGIDVTKVAQIENADNSVKALPNGVIQLDGDFNSLNVYDLTGTMLISLSNPEGTISTGLGSGIYIVKAVTASGNPITIKTTF